MARHTVFIAQDFALVEVMQDIARRLSTRGIEVIRGPESRPGERTIFPRERWQEWFGRASIAMFSSRSMCNRELLEWAPRLIGVVNPTIGLDTVDVAAASELGIIVGHGATPENFNSMAEATVMLMLMCLYNPAATSDVLHGRRPRPKPTPTDMWARMLMGRTVGLVGFGRIGRAVAARLQGWHARILVADPYVKPETMPAYAELAPLERVLSESDIVAVLVAVTPQTRKLIGSRELGLMKREAFLINTARGDAVDETALTQALRERKIAGAALDTFEVEPLPAASPLRSLDNVYLTPHMVGHTREVFSSFPPAAEENILRILAGEPPLYCKNPEAIPRWRERLARLK